MEVTCINAEGYYLTNGKTYKVHYEGNRGYTIINDIGELSEYPFDIFN